MPMCHFWSCFCLNLNDMSTTHTLPPAGTERLHEPNPEGAAALAAEQGLVTTPHQPGADQFAGQLITLTPPLARLPVELDVAVPLRGFRVRTLLTLTPGQIIESQWGNGEDVPLNSGAVQLAWSEFEVVDTQLAVRVTRLA
jgi:flagellar motor switch/type III secretory pathway protein FliN